MSRRAKLAATAVVVLAAVVPVSARAAQQVPFTIDEQVDFGNQSFTFTSTSPQLCPSGRFVDDAVADAFAHSGHAQNGGFNLIFRSAYICDDGSGTIEILKHVFITFVGDGFTNMGPAQILGGTGRYSRLRGHGFENGGTPDGLQAAAAITGSLVVP